jgi:hypothetical protein
MPPKWLAALIDYWVGLQGSGAYYCNWKAVVCNDIGRVTSLALLGNLSTVTALPAEMASVTYLQTIGEALH